MTPENTPTFHSQAFFVYDEESKSLGKYPEENPFGTEVVTLGFEELEEIIASGRRPAHVVVAGRLELIKRVLLLARTVNFTVGLIALPEQKNLISYFDLPLGIPAAVELALQKGDPQPLDLVFCNNRLALFKATMGRIPIFDALGYSTRRQLFVNAVKQLIGIKLLPFKFTTAGGKTVETCACGCMVIQHHRKSWAAGMVGYDTSSADGNVSLLIPAPFSIADYGRFVFRTLGFPRHRGRVSDSMGYIESPQITIESEVELEVTIDGGECTRTPVDCRVEERAVQVNFGPAALEEIRNTEADREERVLVGNLPRGKEISKLQDKPLPFFSIASEDRFKDLFIALRDDARINASYIVLMLLSTLLATIGVYLNSPAVVIGAMLLAPLMAPIVSLAMGLLRRNNELTYNSLKKIILGVLLAVTSSSLLVMLFSYKPVTNEMMGRLNPSLLDLGVAIIAGVAAAYTKSFKEVMQGLAGVAIAVALVPPLAVAGIGLGRGDLYFFGHAFLLFLTNLVGIVFSALFSFRVLGFSPDVKGRRSVLLVVLLLVTITIPLYFSYTRIVEKYQAEKNWQVERFLINGKYIIIRNIRFSQQREHMVVFIDILARESLSRNDLNLLKRKIRRNLPGDFVIQAKVEYIL